MIFVGNSRLLSTWGGHEQSGGRYVVQPEFTGYAQRCKIITSVCYRADNEKKQTTQIVRFIPVEILVILGNELGLANPVINTQVDVCELFPGFFLHAFAIVIVKQRNKDNIWV